jgi:3'-5' exonuclease
MVVGATLCAETKPQARRDSKTTATNPENLLGVPVVLAVNSSVATLVFDIETTAQPLENFDEAQQEYLFRETEKIDDAIARQARRDEIARMMSLWPFTSQVVCIAMLNAESLRGQSIFIAEDFEDAGEAGPVEFVPCADETELLTAFWDVAKHYDSVVTFNGRGFDVPFIYLRSALLNVPISKKNWLGYRYATEPHCDLAEQFTFYSVSGRDGAARRFNLDFYCKAFGVESPKSAGVTGMDVGTLMAAGKFREIAEYCLRDVRATVELYKIWKERLAGIK